jgi:hypothetical protein
MSGRVVGVEFQWSAQRGFKLRTPSSEISGQFSLARSRERAVRSAAKYVDSSDRSVDGIRLRHNARDS